MDKYHKEIIEEIKKNQHPTIEQWVNEKYHGNPHFFYGLSNPQKHKIAKAFVKSHKDLSDSELIDLLDSLFRGNSYEEKTIGAEIAWSFPDFIIPLEKIDQWLEELVGWAEIDSLCQSKFLIPHIENDWKTTEKYIRKWSESENVSKRRASLVLLVKPAMFLEDKRILHLALEIVEKLSHEKSVLITKAISWILRALIKYHKHDIKLFVDRKGETLPKIAIRETLRKIETGKK